VNVNYFCETANGILWHDSVEMLDSRRADQSEPSEPIVRAPRILLADDDAVSRQLLASALVRSGFEVHTAENGAEALKLIAATEPDLLVLDFEMPDLNGAEVCQELRASENEALRDLPVIMLTAHAGEQEEIVCLEAGANDFVTKPVSREILAARIQTQLRLRALTVELRQHNDELGRWRTAQEADLVAAQATQRVLIPSAAPAVKGWTVQSFYHPVIQVGGDVFGWRAAGAGRWLFWVADATGHGAAAALFTALAAQLFRQAAETDSEPCAILRAVNREFRTVFHGRSFMTACCALIEPGGGLTFCSAGHPPLLVRRKNGTVESFGPHGTVLGLRDDSGPDLEQSKTALKAGDVALLYTDGLVGFRQANGERFSHKAVETHLPHVAPGKEFLERLLTGLKDQSDGKGSDDDMAAVALIKG
jgi:sigma-B regulation protein RsbU (phosphoserine phosphatase)